MHIVRSSIVLSAAALSVAAACAEAGAPGADSSDSFHREVRGGRLLSAPLSAPGADAPEDVALALARASHELEPALGALDRSHFARPESVDIGTRSGGRVSFVSMRQMVRGVPIAGAYLNLALRADGDAPELVAADFHLYHEPSVEVTPQLDEAAAVELARSHLRTTSGAVVRAVELTVVDVDGALRLVWDVAVEGHHERARVIAGGGEAGRVLIVDDRVYDASGAARGVVAVGGAPGGAGVPTAVALASLRVHSGHAEAFTDADGSFALAGDTGATVDARLSGAAVRVYSKSGANLAASTPAGDGVALSFAAAEERSLAQVTAYHTGTAARDYLLANGVGVEALGGPLTTNVNLASTCNAYFSPAARTINFFRAGGGCNNSAEASIIAHEYGHFADHAHGGITDGGLSEGWGDVLACYLLDDPTVGEDLVSSGPLRTCDNDYRYPASGHDEVHELGQAWAGFAWHLREQLIAEYGASEGDAIARALIVPALVSNAPDIPAAVRAVIVLDDDDGDASNGTPHWELMRAAAARHGLEHVFDADVVPPAPIDDLTGAAASPTSVTLSWTASGDDDHAGQAAGYELRYAATPIDEASFPAATPVDAPDPVASGEAQQVTVDVPPYPELYFAIRVVDEAGNGSPLATVAVDLPEPVVVFADGAEDGLGGWQASGLWHVTERAASAGARSFWYGREETGNYDTGARNAGGLVSPVIDLTGVERPRLVLDERVRVEDSAGFDRLTIRVVDVDDASVAVVAHKISGSTGGQFHRRLFDLAGLAGRRVQVELLFDTVDGSNNSYEGWYVDDVRVLADAAPPARGVLVINEVLADPPQGFDANRDGVYSYRDDEMIELVNAGAAPLDLGGAAVSDSVRTRLVVPENTILAPGEALLVFGGGAPNFGEVRALVAEGLFLNNEGDSVRVRAAGGEILAEMTYGPEGGQNQSLVRQTDADPLAPFVLHTSVSELIASPGAHADGEPYGDITPSPASTLLINEVLADPPVGYDANGDGRCHFHEDEMIELANIGDADLDLSGATVSDAVQVRTVLPDGLVLGAGQVFVLFGGGAPVLSTPNVTALVSSSPLQLNNDGDAVTVRDADGQVLAVMAYAQGTASDQSLVRAADLDPDAPLVPHSEVSALVASPGLRGDGSPF